METTLQCGDYIGIMENKMETRGCRVHYGLCNKTMLTGLAPETL